jgi:16S rRNA (uracil1498-N3)-methyltransferase
MPLVHRFYASDLETADETVALDDTEARHLVRVLRIAPGTDVRVFNGRGIERLARVELADARGVVLRVIEPAAAAPELGFALTLMHGVLKGDAMDAVVRDAVVLGVTRIQPIVTVRSEIGSRQLAGGQRIERWHRIAVSSAKQCGRAVVPVIGSPIDPTTALGASTDADHIVLAEPAAVGVAQRVEELPIERRTRDACVWVGPEGGWDERELRAFGEGATIVTCGGLTLRADMAAVVVLPVLRYIWRAL